MMKRVELLSPVGNMDMLYQAIHNGADAVYLAGTQYGARKFARNFSNEELASAIEYAHLYGVKVYVTVNTLIYERELESVLDYLYFLDLCGVDAVIMQDIGLIYITRQMLPNLEIHASTQCHNHNKEIAKLWKNLGITRLVLAREMSRDEIKNIDIDIEKEAFVYGALCVCYSGCCLFSSLNGGRSGNRGECVGSCRLPYQLVKNNQVIDLDNEYLLSTRELNTMDYIEELIESGIDSFKIEGRMKSPYYVGYVTRLYRMLIDKYYDGGKVTLTDEELINLKKLYNRSFTKGYINNSNDIMNIKSPNHQGIVLGKVMNVSRNKIYIKLEGDNLYQEDGIRFLNSDKGMIVNRLYNQNNLLVNHIDKGKIAVIDNKFKYKFDEGDIVLKTIDKRLIKELEEYSLRKIKISFKCCFRIGKKFSIQVSDGIHTIKEEGDIVEKAINREVSSDNIGTSLAKLGNTPFIMDEIIINKDDNIFVNLKSINEVRRSLVEKLIQVRTRVSEEVIKGEVKEIGPVLSDGIRRVSVLVRNEEQLLCCLDNDIDFIYVVDYQLYLKYRHLDNIYYRVPRVFESLPDLTSHKLLVGEMGSLNKYRDNNTLVGDYFLNVVNSRSIEFLNTLGINRVTLSVELEMDKVKDIMSKSCNVELIIYGRVELMVMKYCPLRKCLNYCSQCKGSQDKFSLRDSKGNDYPMVRDNCITHIMHNKNIDKINDIEDYLQLGITNYRIELFNENKEEVERIINRVKIAIMK